MNQSGTHRLNWAFLTEVTNALGQVKTTIYDYYLGRPTSVTDANQSTSTLAYTDPLDRPTSFALGTASTTIDLMPEAYYVFTAAPEA